MAESQVSERQLEFDPLIAARLMIQLMDALQSPSTEAPMIVYTCRVITTSFIHRSNYQIDREVYWLLMKKLDSLSDDVKDTIARDTRSTTFSALPEASQIYGDRRSDPNTISLMKLIIAIRRSIRRLDTNLDCLIELMDILREHLTTDPMNYYRMCRLASGLKQQSFPVIRVSEKVEPGTSYKDRLTATETKEPTAGSEEKQTTTTGIELGLTERLVSMESRIIERVNLLSPSVASAPAESTSELQIYERLVTMRPSELYRYVSQRYDELRK